jgi:hypothetical protein
MPELLALIRALKAIAKDLGRAERAARAILNKRPRKRPERRTRLLVVKKQIV